ncbi:hypothetical protein HanRHA438_Chr10g0437991 [Helianthus annuus]|nr:hypothetical protein HanRHA438_Chr10g0437991 [Helianthus annuus]
MIQICWSEKFSLWPKRMIEIPSFLWPTRMFNLDLRVTMVVNGGLVGSGELLVMVRKKETET